MGPPLEVDEVRTMEALESRTFSQRYLEFNPHFTLFRKGYCLCVQLVHRLGDVPPKDDRDRVLRDLACDTLDSLWLAELALLRGYENQSILLLRRTYETTSLMVYFINFPEKADEWEKGKTIRPSEIRESLDDARLREPKQELSAMYKVYSLFAHVNRDTVSYRKLGEGNRLPLGCQGMAEPILVSALVRELLNQTMWFLDVFNYCFLEASKVLGRHYGDQAVGYRAQVEHLVAELPGLWR